MPAPEEPKTLEKIVEEVGVYPIEAFDFVQRGLTYTVNKVHGPVSDPQANRHVSGQQLCHGLREFALAQWGLLARTVLRRWNITRTEDFGRIVFALVENGHMSKTETDTLDDFKNVFDFASAFDENYRIPSSKS